MSKLPLTKPIYMAELGRRMGLPTHEARRALRRIEHAKKVRLLFKARRTQRGRVWTTEAILKRYCPQLIDRPKRIEQETRLFVRSLSEKLDALLQDMQHVKDSTDHELSRLRHAIESHLREGHR